MLFPSLFVIAGIKTTIPSIRIDGIVDAVTAITTGGVTGHGYREARDTHE